MNSFERAPWALVRLWRPVVIALYLDPLADQMLAVAQGDRDAFGRLYDEVAPSVFGVARRVLANTAMAEEVTQEVMVDVWRTAGRYDPKRGSAKAWITTMAHRRAVDRVRSEESSRRRERNEMPDLGPGPDSVSEGLEAEEEQGAVVAALASLSDLQRQAITMAFYQGFTYREVAAELGVPEGTIKTRIRDGLARLKSQLGGQGIGVVG